MSILTGKRIIVGVCGGIAAYKICDWVRHLKRAGAEVTVVMTDSACKFVTPLTFAALSGNKVYTDIFAQEQAEAISHIDLATGCELLIIAPATAQTIARLAHGMADTLLSTITLATTAKVLVFPAMNSKMLLHPATQSNLEILKKYNYSIIESDSGEMACGTTGPGRLPEWSTAEQAIKSASSRKDLLAEKILITAGPTHEDLDPVRFLTNRSSGKMGYALAQAASQRGAEVTLISGPTNLEKPMQVETIMVRSATEMQAQVEKLCTDASIIIKSAAVSDYRPTENSPQKLKKGSEDLSLPLSANNDILKELGKLKKESTHFPLLVGFAAESENHLDEGLRKLRQKNLDMIVVNDILGSKTGFAADTNQVTIIDRQGTKIELPLLSKEMTAHRILDVIKKMQH